MKTSSHYQKKTPVPGDLVKNKWVNYTPHPSLGVVLPSGPNYIDPKAKHKVYWFVNKSVAWHYSEDLGLVCEAGRSHKV